MSRTPWLLLVSALTAAALAATYVFAPAPMPATRPGPAPTPFGWDARLELLAGDGVAGLRDGAPLQARFADPYGLARAADGTLYVADAGDNNRLRRIAPDGQVTTLAGAREGFADGAGAAAAFHTPSGLALDGAGNVYVADTGNHAVRRVTPQGLVTTVAGTGTAGYRDGPGAQAQFNGPIGVAVDAAGRVYVADTYNDRIRVIEPDGHVRTLAGGDEPGHQDGRGDAARFDTPTALAVDARQRVWVADSRNHAIRRIGPQGDVATVLRGTPEDGDEPRLHRPLGLALSHDGVLYVSEGWRGRVLQLGADGRTHVLAGDARGQRLSRPTALVGDGRGGLYVADASGHRIHRIARASEPAPPAAVFAVGPAPHNPLPRTEGRWPLHPQDDWHEVVGTLGEVRGDYRGESRHHLHNGLDIRGDIGQRVLAIADAKVSNPLPAWGLGGLGEGLELDAIGYVHMRVGRTTRGVALDPERLPLLADASGELQRVRVRRGTRFKAGDVLGTINPMAHVHLIVGATGYERNAIELRFRNYADTSPPRVDRIALFDAQEQPLLRRERGRLVLPRSLPGVRIVVDAWDQVDRNLPRRRLGLHALGFQVLDAEGRPLPGFEAPRMNIEFGRMPAESEAVKVAYAPGSGVTVHGSATTRFQYVVTNTVRDGELGEGWWEPASLPAGDYTLRITARDFSGNEAGVGRDLSLRLE